MLLDAIIESGYRCPNGEPIVALVPVDNNTVLVVQRRQIYKATSRPLPEAFTVSFVAYIF